MDTFTSIVGWLVILAVAILIAGGVAWGAAEAFKRVMHWMYCKAYYQASMDMARRVRSSAHWFSEDPGAWIALKGLAERLERDQSIEHADQWREEWRKAVAEWRERFPATAK